MKQGDTIPLPAAVRLQGHRIVTAFGAMALWVRLRSSYWFLPALVTFAAVALAQLFTFADRATEQPTAWLSWAYGGGPDGARALLSAIAGSMITVVSVTFSVLVVALTVSSQHFGPRLLASFMRDTASQLALGMFSGTFAYCLLVLRTVRGDGGERYTLFVPHLAVTGAVALTLVSVAILIYYVHHIALSMQVSEITARVAAELEAAIDRIYPQPIGEDVPSIEAAPPPAPPHSRQLLATDSGYVQAIDGDTLLALAATHETTIWVVARPGDFIIENAPLAAAASPVDVEPLEAGVRRAFALGADRTSQQDVAFAAQQLVEVALRALSPGVNEPFAAITCLDRLAQGLAKLAARQVPSAVRAGADGSVRVVAPPRTFHDLVQEVLEPIVLSAPAQTPSVLERVVALLRMLAGGSRRLEDRIAIARVAQLVRVKARASAEPSSSRIDHALEALAHVVGVGLERTESSLVKPDVTVQGGPR